MTVAFLLAAAAAARAWALSATTTTTTRRTTVDAEWTTKGSWLPVCSASGFGPLDGPQRVEVCGERYAVWEHEGRWSVLVDTCPHKLAPLSQGRVTEDGCVECPYHGWQFDADGKTAKVPQGNTDRAKSARSLPTMRTNDLVWAFFPVLDGSIDDTPDKLYPRLAEETKPYFSRTLPYSFDMLIENFNDPAHIPFAHHGLQGVRSDGGPIPMKLLACNETHVESTFEDVVRGKPRKGITSFRAPCRYHFRCLEDDDTYDVKLEMYCVPVKPGASRVFLVSPLSDSVPTWLAHAATNRFLNTDVWLHDAELRLRAKEGDERGAYNAVTSSDLGGSAWRTFWRDSGMASSGGCFGPAKYSELKPITSRKAMIDPWKYHSSQCAHCRKALKRAITLERAALLGGGLALALAEPPMLRLGGALVAAGILAATRKVKSIIRGDLDASLLPGKSVAHAGGGGGAS
ncbi:hypothetical protein CTAYLR_004490 [Chrysophaeum taylorii]|uniref:Rieske domain-containing protein n=1 Tax=Chrysophaeum taylorii TaxID=2483200 RepID=A0AAD7UAV5_9STRA|nr:hypothetical protein CTAYLR_004490 [Chrysophaeum taylorii]